MEQLRRYLVALCIGAEYDAKAAKKHLVRPKISAEEIEARIMALIHGGHRRIRGITIVYVGSLGTEPNWFARPNPSRVSEASMREFVSALAKVRQEFDLLIEDGIDSPDYMSGLSLGGFSTY